MQHWPSVPIIMVRKQTSEAKSFRIIIILMKKLAFLEATLLCDLAVHFRENMLTCQWKYLGQKKGLSVTYQAMEGRKEQEKSGQVVLAARGHIHFWPSGSGGQAQRQHTDLGQRRPCRTEGCRPTHRSEGDPKSLQRCTWSWRRYRKCYTESQRQRRPVEGRDTVKVTAR